jgi:hypothetical protein
VRALVHVYTDHPDRKEIVESVMSIILPEVRLLPDEIIVRGAAGEVLPRVSLLVIPGSARDYQITAVEPPSTNIQAQYRQSAVGTYRIDLANVPAGPELNGKSVRITTTLPKMKEIEVPIRHVPAPGG